MRRPTDRRSSDHQGKVTHARCGRVNPSPGSTLPPSSVLRKTAVWQAERVRPSARLLWSTWRRSVGLWSSCRLVHKSMRRAWLSIRPSTRKGGLGGPGVHGTVYLAEGGQAARHRAAGRAACHTPRPVTRGESTSTTHNSRRGESTAKQVFSGSMGGKHWSGIQ